MDMSTFALYLENDLLVCVVNINKESSLSEIIEGHIIGSLLKKEFSNGK